MRFPKASDLQSQAQLYKEKIMFWRRDQAPETRVGLIEDGSHIIGEDQERRSVYTSRDYDKGTQMALPCCDVRLNGEYPPDGAQLPSDGQVGRDLTSCYYWSGNPFFDYIWFVFQWHPLLGMFLSHPKHPWSKGERFVQFMIENLWTVFPTLAVVNNTEPGHIRTVRLYMLVTIPCCIISYFLYYMLIMDIYFKDMTLGPKLAKVNWLCACIGKFAFFLSHAFLCFCFCGAACFAFASLTLMAYQTHTGEKAALDMHAVISSWFWTRGQSWLLWFTYMTLMPYVGFAHGWWIERNAKLAGIKDTGFMALQADDAEAS